MYSVSCLLTMTLLLCCLYTELLHIRSTNDPWIAYNLSIKLSQEWRLWEFQIVFVSAYHVMWAISLLFQYQKLHSWLLL
jgi:hypothetical protein